MKIRAAVCSLPLLVIAGLFACGAGPGDGVYQTIGSDRPPSTTDRPTSSTDRPPANTNTPPGTVTTQNPPPTGGGEDTTCGIKCKGDLSCTVSVVDEDGGVSSGTSKFKLETKDGACSGSNSGVVIALSCDGKASVTSKGETTNGTWVVTGSTITLCSGTDCAPCTLPQ